MRYLTPDLLLRCYAAGQFPMADDRDDTTVYLVDPDQRGIFPLDRFHVPRSLRKPIRRRVFELRVDTSFRAVIEACAEATPDRPRTWLNDELIDLYTVLAQHGYGHSVECWQDGRLVGGLYGVSLGAAFFGESMFSRVTDASKVALVELVGRLRAGGYQLLDAQFITPHLRRFGAIAISRQSYHRRLQRALASEATFPRATQGFAERVLAGAGDVGGGELTAGAGGVSGSRHSRTQTS